MKLRPRSLAFILILALALGATLASASPQWAVTAGRDKVFLTKYDLDSVQLQARWGLSGSALTGIATWHNYVFVADSAGDTGHLRVGKIANPPINPSPTIDWIGNIPLTDGKLLKDPSAVAVDESGGVYVLGSRWQDGSDEWHSNYAYVTSASGTWTDTPNVSIVDLSNTSKALADIATTGLATGP